MSSLNNLQTFKDKLAREQVAVGTAILLSDPAVSELYADTGYDFTWIDAEHGPLDLQTVLAHVMAVRGTDCAPFVRVAANDPVRIKPLLDLAPAGIIVPLIRTVDDARSAVAACKYPPRGIRGYGPRRGDRFGGVPQQEYLKTADDQTMVILQIETIEAVNQIDGILATEGVDAICLGPNDLSGSIGLLGQTDHPDVMAAMETVVDKARQTDVYLGLATGFNPEWVSRWIDRGVQWLCLNNDHANMHIQAKAVLDGARAIRKKSSGG